MKVQVTADDIFCGKARSCCECPVALAAGRAVGGLIRRDWQDYLEVNIESISVYAADCTGRYSWATPPAAVEFIQRFDDSLPVEPFEFELEENAAAEPAHNGKES